MNAVIKFAERCLVLVVVGIALGLLCALHLAEGVQPRRANRLRLARTRALPDFQAGPFDAAVPDLRPGIARLALGDSTGEEDDAALFV